MSEITVGDTPSTLDTPRTPHLQKCTFSLAPSDHRDTSPNTAQEIEIALKDLNLENKFDCPEYPSAQGHHIEIQKNCEAGQLSFKICDHEQNPLHSFVFSLDAFKRERKDYKMIYDAYNKAALGFSSPDRIEAIDMARRGIHNEGAEKLSERFKNRGLFMDHETARRLFFLWFCLTQTDSRGLTPGCSPASLPYNPLA